MRLYGPTCVCALTVDGVTLYIAPGLFLFQRQGNWDSERSSNFPRAAQLPRVGATFPDPSEQMALEPLLIAAARCRLTLSPVFRVWRMEWGGLPVDRRWVGSE